LTTIAIIPARGGSKGIPRKNLLKIKGISLLERSINCAINAGIKHVYVSTDNHEIAEAAVSLNAKVIKRPSELSGDTNSSESAVTHALEEILVQGDLLVSSVAFLQATSPFTRSVDLIRGIRMLTQDNSVFSAVPFHNFLWTQNADTWEPLGHAKNQRTMRQQLPPTVMETGNFYLFPVRSFLAQGTRFCNVPIPVLIDPLTTLQVDSPEDLGLASKIAAIVES
jgi:CMP-N-acetylneuraminic acid synthetase